MVWRLSLRTGVESARCAAESAVHAAAAITAAASSEPVCATYAVMTGNAPHARANQRSEWNAPSKSSRL